MDFYSFRKLQQKYFFKKHQKSNLRSKLPYLNYFKDFSDIHATRSISRSLFTLSLKSLIHQLSVYIFIVSNSNIHSFSKKNTVSTCWTSKRILMNMRVFRCEIDQLTKPWASCRPRCINCKCSNYFKSNKRRDANRINFSHSIAVEEITGQNWKMIEKLRIKLRNFLEKIWYIKTPKQKFLMFYIIPQTMFEWFGVRSDLNVNWYSYMGNTVLFYYLSMTAYTLYYWSRKGQFVYGTRCLCGMGIMISVINFMFFF